jgi:uncharacterized protein
MSTYPGSWPHEEPSGALVPAQDRNWAMAAHIGSLVSAWVALGLFAPLIVLLVKGGSSPFVRRHAVESLNFQLTTLLYVAVSVLLFVVGIGFVMILFVGLFYLISVVLATVRASNGEFFRYPLTIRLVS